MIPGLLASEVSSALREFIVTGFEGEFRRLVEEQDGDALSKQMAVCIRGAEVTEGAVRSQRYSQRNWRCWYLD